MKKQWIAAVGILALGSTLAVAAPGGGKHHGRGGHAAYGEKFAEKLNLTDAQKQQIEQIRKNTRLNNAAFFEQKEALHAEMKAARQSNDTARLESLKDRKAAQRAQMKQIFEAERAQILSILTPAQKTQFEAMKSNHGGKQRRGGQKK